MGRLEVAQTWPSVRLRYVARVNPLVSLEGLSAQQEVTFVPLECVWPNPGLDTENTRLMGEVSSGYTRFVENDVLVPKITPTFEAGRSAVASGLKAGQPAFGTTELHVLRPSPKLDSRFLWYRTLASDFLNEGTAAMVGVAGQRRVPVDFIKDFPILLPPIDEQRRINEFLDLESARLDRLIRLKRELLRQFRERRRAFMYAQVKDLPREMKLSYSAIWRSGGTPPKSNAGLWQGTVPWVSTKDLAEDEIHDTIDHITEEAAADHSCVIPAGSLLVATRGMSLAKRLPLAVVRKPMAFNQDLKALMPVAGLDVDFLRIVLRGYEPEILANVVEAAHGTRRLETRHLKALRIPLPELSAQRAVVGEVRRFEAETLTAASNLERQVALLNERRQALITAAVTGQIEPVSSGDRAVAA